MAAPNLPSCDLRLHKRPFGRRVFCSSPSHVSFLKVGVLYMRPIRLSHHQMEGQVELTHSAHALSSKRSGGVDRASRGEVRESIAIEIGATFRRCANSKEEKSMNAALLILHVFMGLGIATHGARSCWAGSGGDDINYTGASGKSTAMTSDSFNAVAEPRQRGGWRHRSGPEDGAAVGLEASTGAAECEAGPGATKLH